ncbi:hypothetical protein LCGC14_0948030 [marine sediment metagenome]|uniref:Uncharacterized protein n=1 Tax=marine sediment metagenome TaxID=412755 RepID=A0A0F9P470_9ZZZZ
MFVDWSGIILAILRVVKKEKHKVDPKYIVIKPRMLSDDNILKGVAALRAVLAFVPPAAIAVPVLSLGEMGFQIWKRISLARDYDQIKFPPMDPNTMRLQFEFDEELSKHYGHLCAEHNWNDETISELEVIWNDLEYITSLEMLQGKYPHLDEEWLTSRATRNKDILQANLYQIEQEIQKVSHRPEIKANLAEGLNALKSLFPAMNDWSLFNSEAFQEIFELIDTVF